MTKVSKKTSTISMNHPGDGLPENHENRPQDVTSCVENTDSVYNTAEALSQFNLRQRLRIAPREGYHTCFIRESDWPLYEAIGANIVPKNRYRGQLKVQDSTNSSSGIRVPSRDSDEYLLGVEMPLDIYEMTQAESKARNKQMMDALKSSNFKRKTDSAEITSEIKVS